MNIAQPLTWQSFKDRLLEHPELDLQFQYADDCRVDASYHITEIKQAPIVSVDCGGKMNSWTEVIVQLWEPGGKEQERPMTVSKALSIIKIVEKALPLNPLATVKIEFGKTGFDTRQLLPAAILADGVNLVVDLRPDATGCKALDRGETCGTDAKGDECCAPAEKQVVELKVLATADACCTPGSGCC